MQQRGKVWLITGINGAGKGSAGQRAVELLAEQGVVVSYVYGPGLSTATRWMQQIVLDEVISPKDRFAQALLYFAIHAEVAATLAVRLERGENILLDRGPETTLIYNVLEAGLDENQALLSTFAQIRDTLAPALTMLLDLPAEVALARSGKQKITDQFQTVGMEKYERRRELYRQLAQQEKGWVMVDATRPLEEVAREVAGFMLATLK